MSRSLIFLIVEIKSDIIFAIFIISCFTYKLFQQNTKALKTIMKYFKNMKILNIIYSIQEKDVLIIKNYSDLD